MTKENPAVEKGAGRALSLVLLLALPIVGITLCLILAAIHAELLIGGLHSGPLCGPDDACNALAASPYNSFASIPLAYWGLAAYASLLVFVLCERLQAVDSGWCLIQAQRLILFSLVCDLLLGSIMILEGSPCGYCLATYGINVLLLLCSSRARKVIGKGVDHAGPLEKAVLFGALAFGGLCVGAGAWTSHYLRLAEIGRAKVILSSASTSVEVRVPEPIAFGPEDAFLELVVMHDFRCPHCKTFRRLTRLLRKRHPKRLRVVYVNYPLDSSCNPKASRETGACTWAKAALWAAEQGRFDDFVASCDQRRGRSRTSLGFLLAKFSLSLEEFEQSAVQERLGKKLKAEIALCHSLEVSRLPSFFINGYRFEGQPSLGSLEYLLDRVQHQGIPTWRKALIDKRR